MRSLLRLVAIGAGVLALTSCATMNVSSQVQHGLDFSKYHTFDWGTPDALPVSDPRLAKDPFFQDHLEGAVEKALQAKGYRRATGSPDLLVHYHAAISERIDVDRTDRNRGYGYQGNPTVTTHTFEAGTIVIDIVDARTNRVVWRGWAQRDLAGILDNHDRLAKTIDEAVTRMLARFPPL